MAARHGRSSPTAVEVTGDPSSPLAKRLRDRLARLSGDLEEGEMPPTEAAVQKCEETLVAAADHLPTDRPFPFPHLTTAGVGDLSCEWRKDDRLVLLFISAQGEACLYRVTLAGTQVVTREPIAPASADELLIAIEWLVAPAAAAP